MLGGEIFNQKCTNIDTFSEFIIFISSQEVKTILLAKYEDKDLKRSLKNQSKEHIKELVKIICQNNPQTAKAIIENLSEHFQHDDYDYDIRMSASDANMEIIQLFDKIDIQFLKDII